MATERTIPKPRLAAQAAVLKAWGQEWRRANGKGQQDLGRVAGYGSDESPKSAAVAISRIESGKTDPAGRYRQRLLDALGHTEAELEQETDRALAAQTRPGVFTRAMAGPIHEENEARRAQIIASSNLLTERVTFQIRNAERTLDRARGAFILPFLETAATVDWQPLLAAQGLGATGGTAGSLEGQIRGLRGQTELSILKTVSRAAQDPGPEAGTSAGTAAGMFVSLSAAGTVSTGTAIASLSGAAASSSTLAWLGGGSLAAGRMGVAGGTAVLTGIVALPALLAIGGVLIWKGRKLRKEAEAEAEKLDAAQQALEDMQDALPRAERWNETQQVIIQRAELLGRTIQSRYAESTPFTQVPADRADRRIDWDSIPADARKALDVELKLLSIILDTQALPVWLGVTTVSEPDLTASQENTATVSEEWIDESLTFAQFDLDDHEEWVRSLMAHDSRT
ncbi:helix-turn-helix transcriptional regulator [Microbacterium sp.]|uniref:helix-turn-helix domain-containing protein n=1 Tax=Microbacterium sp. TaxID=51671 RepID=UPI002E36496B|nr:helix-turn-helix transcriptional regulator [Microbacterium sp.]HEX5729147.1 helix-turn-helix transcriptional regulator [Microbacterium sp.]